MWETIEAAGRMAARVDHFFTVAKQPPSDVSRNGRRGDERVKSAKIPGQIPVRTATVRFLCQQADQDPRTLHVCGAINRLLGAEQ